MQKLTLLLAAALILGCAGPSPWLRPQGELLQLERQAAGALQLASEPRTRGALGLCVLSAQAAVRSIDRLLQEQEKLRQARKAGAAIPELERSVARATTDAEDSEAQARTDCRRAGVSLTTVEPAAVDGGADAAPPAPSTATSSPTTGPAPALPSPHQPPAAAAAPAPPPVPDGGAR